MMPLRVDSLFRDLNFVVFSFAEQFSVPIGSYRLLRPSAEVPDRMKRFVSFDLYLER